MHISSFDVFNWGNRVWDVQDRNLVVGCFSASGCEVVTIRRFTSRKVLRVDLWFGDEVFFETLGGQAEMLGLADFLWAGCVRRACW